MKNQELGQHSNSDGEFAISKQMLNNEFIFSKAGYQDTSVMIQSGLESVIMKKVEIARDQFSNVEGKRVITLGSVNGENSGDLSNLNVPVVYLKYFPSAKSYGYYLDLLKLKTQNEIPLAKINVRLYSATKNLEPGDYIYDEDIILSIKEGERISKVDLSELKLRMPENGLFVGIEPLIIPENIYHNDDRNLITDEITKRMEYMPKLVIMRNERPTDKQYPSFIFIGGKFKAITNSQLTHALEFKLRRP
jgi:hypothetical protein